MAENELLDLSNPYIYKRWQKILASGAVTAVDAANALYSDFSAALRDAIRKEPLSRVFAACGEDRAALQAAVAACKDRALAKQVEQACHVDRSGGAASVAHVLANLLISSITDQCNRQSLSLLSPLTREGHQAIEAATVARLQAARPEIVLWLSAALKGDVSEVPKPPRVPKPSTKELLKTSLVPTFGRINKGAPNV